MDKKSAQQLIENTFNAKFDENRFTLFIKNFLNDIEPKSNNYSGNYIWDDHKEHINAYKRIGKYIDPEGDALDVLIVEVKSVTKLERARTSLRNFVIKHLSKFDKDYALVAFCSKEDNGEDWRFSFIKLEHQSYLDEEKQKVKTRKEFTPAKRYSFLVGINEQAHTAKTQILPLLQNIANNPTVEDIENAFSIEKVTDEFFTQYKDLYVKLFEHFENDSHIQAELNKANIDNARFTKKLLGQIVFLYFLQKKGWLGVPENETWGKGQKRFIQNLFNEAQSKNKNYFKDYLQPLFYEALAKERNNENSYYKKFDCRIPFLNGGLFEAEYDWQNANITIPENLFRNQEKNKAGDIGTGVLDVFDRYNFTIKEDEPLDKEVAVDPEMLGKVFENMLEITERKSKGAFYTPREIVHYMCQESLIHYLDNSLNNSPPSKGGVPEGGGGFYSKQVPEGGGGFTINNLPHLKTFRKNLRNNLTPAEATLWKLLQKKQLDGRKFRRQHSVANYILDFYCPSEKLAIELDGQGHFEENQAEYDRERDLFLKHCGIKVLRFENKLVWDNTEGLLQAVRDEFGWWKNQPQPPRQPVADTPPFKGGELKKADIETYIREGHFALENDQRIANKGETKTYKYQIPESIRQNADLIDQKLTEIRICDPAIGSGAFPVGLLHELVNAQMVIKPHFTLNYLTEKLNKFGFKERESVNESRYVYRLKRHIIQESLYGVDIDASAIDIARLRLWLSLVVDEDDLDPIETLPNLDYKIVCGNSLISRYDIDMPIEKVFKEFNKGRDDKMDLDKYKALVNAFMDESNHDKKEEFRTLIAEIKSAFKTYFSQGDLKTLNKLKSKLNEYEAVGLFGANKTTAEKKRIKELKATIAKKETERNDIEQAKIYENAIEWRFEFPNLLNDNGDFVGFDVVIGNPPYLRIQGIRKENPSFADMLVKNYQSATGSFDLYVCFAEQGISLSNTLGMLNFIMPVKWTNSAFGKGLRSLIIKQKAVKKIISFGAYQVFNASTYTGIQCFQKESNSLQYLELDRDLSNNSAIQNYLYNLSENSFNTYSLQDLSTETWVLTSRQVERILDKRNNQSLKVSDIFEKFFTGLQTSKDSVYFIMNADKQKNKIIGYSQELDKEVEIELGLLKPLLKGNQVHRYDKLLTNNYVIFPYNLKNGKAILMREKEIEERFPNGYSYLKENESILKGRENGKLRNDEFWYRYIYPKNLTLFDSTKLITPYLSKPSNLSYDRDGNFSMNTKCFGLIKNANYSNSYESLLSVLNSDVCWYYISSTGTVFRGGYFAFTPDYLNTLPIPDLSMIDEKLSLLSVYLLFEDKNSITYNFFESLVNAVVYELYFPEELKTAGKEIIKHLGDLKPITPLRQSATDTSPQGEELYSEEEKLAIIQSEFERLYNPNHPVRNAIETLDSIEDVRIIKEALK